MTRALGLGLAALTVAADQLAKSWILAVFAPAALAGREWVLTDYFNLVLVWNRGMSFGFLNRDSRGNPIALSLLAAVIVAALLVWLWRTRDRLVATGIGLVAGGAIGNVIDRFRFGAVADFLDVHWGSWHWPAFNLADSAITVGVALLVIDGLLARRESPN